MRSEVLDHRDCHVEPLTRAAAASGKRKRYAFKGHEFFQRLNPRSPVSKDRLEDQTARLCGPDVAEELMRPVLVDDQHIVASQELLPAVAEFVLRDRVVEIGGG